MGVEKEQSRREIESANMFFQTFDGANLTTSEGKDVKLRVTQFEAESEAGLEPHWVIQYEGYPTSGDAIDLHQENYMEFKINPEDPNQIVSVWASLEHPDLKSKGIFQQFRRLYGANFPVGFSSHVQIENERTREQLFAIRNLLISRKISEDEAKRQILDNYKLQERVDSGFNKIRVEFEKGELVSIVTEKVPDLKSLDFDVNFNL